MKLARLELAPFALPLTAPLETGSVTHQVRRGWVVRITADDGRQGLGEATPLVSQGTESLEECRRALSRAKALEGGALSDVDALLEPWMQTPAARHGLELALLDLLGQARSLPIARLLTPTPRTSIAVNVLLRATGVQALREEASLRAREGFRVFKMKVGAQALEIDVARVAAVRARVIGASAELRIDANGAWDLPTARHALERLARFDLALCEQPVASVEDLAALRSPIPLGADEHLADPRDAEAIIARKAAQMLILKPMVLGGLLPALRLAERGLDAGIESLVTTCLDGALARAGALHLALALPGAERACGLATGELLERDLAPEPIAIRDGRASALDRPGLGVAFDGSRFEWEAP